MGGHGTGVLRAYYLLYVIRGLTVGIVGTCSFFVAQNTGVRQNYLVAARGVGTTIAPALLGHLIGRMINMGEAQMGVALPLLAKLLCELTIPRAESSTCVFLAMFGIGVAMAVLDTMATILIGRVHGKQCGQALVVYDTAYGIGCMVAPFIAVIDPQRAWDFLAAVDFLVCAALAGKRTFRGKPTGWQRKLSSCSIGSDAASTASSEVRPPRLVLRAGLAFTFFVQTAMTAVSCWGFTYAATTLQLPKEVAARIPGAFYAACTLARLVLMPITRVVPPSCIMHAAAVLTLLAAFAFYALDHLVRAGASADALLPLLVACFMLMGAGFCPHYSLMIAAMQQHGDLAPQEHGWYGTSTCLGVTAGMWLPGYLSLPLIELVGSACLLVVINSNLKEFPRGYSWKHPEPVAVACRSMDSSCTFDGAEDLGLGA